jgi:preprotein translocase subunit SecG
MLIILVLLQSGKEGMGVIFGGGSSSVFGSSGAGGILVKLTTVMAIIFVITSLSYTAVTSTKATSKSTILDVKFEETQTAPQTAQPTPETPLAVPTPATPIVSPPKVPETPPQTPAAQTGELTIHPPVEVPAMTAPAGGDAAPQADKAPSPDAAATPRKDEKSPPQQ